MGAISVSRQTSSPEPGIAASVAGNGPSRPVEGLGYVGVALRCLVPACEALRGSAGGLAAHLVEDHAWGAGEAMRRARAARAPLRLGDDVTSGGGEAAPSPPPAVAIPVLAGNHKRPSTSPRRGVQAPSRTIWETTTGGRDGAAAGTSRTTRSTAAPGRKRPASPGHPSRGTLALPFACRGKGCHESFVRRMPNNRYCASCRELVCTRCQGQGGNHSKACRSRRPGAVVSMRRVSRAAPDIRAGVRVLVAEVESARARLAALEAELVDVRKALAGDDG